MLHDPVVNPSQKCDFFRSLYPVQSWGQRIARFDTRVWSVRPSRFQWLYLLRDFNLMLVSSQRTSFCYVIVSHNQVINIYQSSQRVEGRFPTFRFRLCMSTSWYELCHFIRIPSLYHVKVNKRRINLSLHKTNIFICALHAKGQHRDGK